MTSRWAVEAMTRYGPMLANPDDQYVGHSLFLYGEFSRHEIDLMTAFLPPRATIIEGGANVGALTVPLAQHVGPRGRVVAIEPQRHCFCMLAGTLAIQSLLQVIPVYGALNGTPDEPTLVPRLDPLRAQNFGGLSIERAITGDHVPTYTLETLCMEFDLPRVDLLKLDIEGMERLVLGGSLDWLRDHKPVCYIENDRREYQEQVIGLLMDAGYQCWWHTPPLFRPDNFRKQLQNDFGDIVSLNILALHPDEPSHHAVDLTRFEFLTAIP